MGLRPRNAISARQKHARHHFPNCASHSSSSRDRSGKTSDRLIGDPTLLKESSHLLGPRDPYYIFWIRCRQGFEDLFEVFQILAVSILCQVEVQSCARLDVPLEATRRQIGTSGDDNRRIVLNRRIDLWMKNFSRSTGVYDIEIDADSPQRKKGLCRSSVISDSHENSHPTAQGTKYAMQQLDSGLPSVRYADVRALDVVRVEERLERKRVGVFLANRLESVG